MEHLLHHRYNHHHHEFSRRLIMHSIPYSSFFVAPNLIAYSNSSFTTTTTRFIKGEDHQRIILSKTSLSMSHLRLRAIPSEAEAEAEAEAEEQSRSNSNDYTISISSNEKNTNSRNDRSISRRRRRRSRRRIEEMVEQKRGGKMVVELVGTFNHLTNRMLLNNSGSGGVIVGNRNLSTSSSRLLFMTLKLSLPALHSIPHFSANIQHHDDDLSEVHDPRSPLSRALTVACLLADLQMDAEVISAGILREVLKAGALTLDEIKNQIGTGTAHLLHESLRVNQVPLKVQVLDDETASALRKFCLTFYEVRALILELALKLDTMRHLNYLPRYKQQILALEVMKIYAPLAHAVGVGTLSLELEDLSFRYLFPYSYLYVDKWLRSQDTGDPPLIDTYREQLLQYLKADNVLADMIEDVTVKGRYKSRFSTMKKLLKDGRKPEQVNDILGLRVIVDPGAGDDAMQRGISSCYRVRELIRSLWKEIPHRTKDYIATPKANGYRSLHMAVDVSNGVRTTPTMEIQIRTTEMDTSADDGTASHSLYKGGLTDPNEAKRLKAIMVAAAELAAIRLGDLPSGNHGEVQIDRRDRVFHLLDKNSDGRISIEELSEIMEELGAKGEDAHELMQLVDSNSDGSLSSEEFELFQRQVEFMRTLEDRDELYRSMLDEKLQMIDSNGSIQVYQEEFGGDGLAVSS